MSLFSALSVSASGMAAQRTRAELLVENHGQRRNHQDAGRRPISPQRCCLSIFRCGIFLCGYVSSRN